jgi:hypothetical protein
VAAYQSGLRLTLVFDKAIISLRIVAELAGRYDKMVASFRKLFCRGLGG